MVQIWNFDGRNWSFNRESCFTKCQKSFELLCTKFIQFLHFSHQSRYSPSPGTSPPLKHKPHSLFYHLHLFSRAITTKLIVWRNVNKFCKQYRLSDLAKCKVHFKQIQAEFMQTTLKIRKREQVILKRQRTKKWVKCNMGWLGCFQSVMI